LAAPAAPGGDRLLADRGEIGYDLAGFGILHDRPDRDDDNNVRRIGARPVASLAMFAMPGEVMLAVLEIQERPRTRRGPDHDIAAFSPVAAVRSAARDELFPPEAYASSAAVAGPDVDFRLVDEFHKERGPEKKEKALPGVPLRISGDAGDGCRRDRPLSSRQDFRQRRR